MSRIFIALCLLGLVSSAADAQPSPFQSETRTSAGWTFTPGASVGGLWDSGLQTDPEAFGGALLQKFVVVANPHAELDFNGKRTHFNLGYSGSFEKYRASDAFWVQRGQAGVSQTLSPRFSISGNMGYSAVPTTDRLLLVGGVVPYVPVNSHWLDAGAGFTFRGGPRTTITGAYRFNLVTFEPPETGGFSQLRDGYNHAQSLGFMRQFSTKLSVGATGEYRRDNVGEVDQQFAIKTVTGEFSLRLGTSSSIFGGGGVSQLENVWADYATTAPAFHGGFERAMRTLRLSAHYSRGFEQAYGFGTLVGSDTFSGTAFVPLADRLYYLNAQLTYTRSDPGRGLDVGFEYTTMWSNVTVGRQLTPYLRGEGFLSFAHQSSSGPDSTNHTRLGIQIVTSKPMRIQ